MRVLKNRLGGKSSVFAANKQAIPYFLYENIELISISHYLCGIILTNR